MWRLYAFVDIYHGYRYIKVNLTFIFNYEGKDQSKEVEISHNNAENTPCV